MELILIKTLLKMATKNLEMAEDIIKKGHLPTEGEVDLLGRIKESAAKIGSLGNCISFKATGLWLEEGGRPGA